MWANGTFILKMNQCFTFNQQNWNIALIVVVKEDQQMIG